MLLSPGCSPRHLSSPSPSTISDDAHQNSKNSSQITPTNSRGQPNVLDEDSYVAAIEKIIERDYFPDISKLRDRLDWLEAIKTSDPVQIRDAQLKIMERRGKKVSNPNPNSKSQTPGSTFMRNFTPLDEFEGKPPKTPGVSDRILTGNGESTDGDGGVDDALSLDEFFRRYTSEDNHSFSKILEKVNRKRKERFGYLTEGEKEDVKTIEDVERDRITDGYGTSDQPPSTLEGWKYTAKNLLMYHPSDRGEAPLTEEERIVRMKGLEKEINRTNTRFLGKMMDSRPKDDGTVEVFYTPVAGGTPVPMSGREGDKLKKYDLEDLRKTPNPFYLESSKKAENGYNFVKTPSPAPGDDESPFITWGEIEGTPLRLELEDTPIDIGGSGDGPHYKIPCPPVRDEKAHSLSREAARKLRERSKMFHKPPLPSPARGGSASPNVRTLSPAAQKFVRNAIGKSSSSIDETLRASYRGASPGLATPKGGRSISRLGRDSSVVSRSPSVREGSTPPWCPSVQSLKMPAESPKILNRDAEPFVEVDPTGRFGRYSDLLGSGAMKKVYRAFDQEKGTEVAWNQVQLRNLSEDPVLINRLLAEVQLLRSLKNKYIIVCYSVWKNNEHNTLNFITEVCTSGNLRDYSKKHRHVSIKALKKWSKQVLEGLEYLHSHDPCVIHRDLNCSNIFVNGSVGRIKIGDFGLAAIVGRNHAAHSILGTPEYMAPELYEEDYTEMVDVYSFGMCLLEMVTMEIPYSECDSIVKIYEKVTTGVKPQSLTKVTDPEVLAFIEKCIGKPRARPSASELMKDPFFAEVYDEETDATD